MSLRQTAVLALNVVAIAGTVLAGGSNTYVFNTSTGAVTLNGVSIVDLGGSSINNRGVVSGIRTWLINGNWSVPAGDTVRFEGSNLASVLVGGNLTLPATSVISASAIGGTPGPGGGQEGTGGSGGIGGAGGNGGGGNSIGGTNGSNASSSTGAPGGSTVRAGGLGGGGGPFGGSAGASGQPRLSGVAGSDGGLGAAGFPGSLGLNNTAAQAQGGAQVPGGAGASAIAVEPSSALGGNSVLTQRTNGNPGEQGPAGVAGGPGGRGPDANNGFGGRAFVPSGAAVNLLNAGNGGGGGSGGGGGGGGAGGSSGGGGGGGSGAGGSIANSGGGGGGGGGGGSGGRGGNGSNGTTGASGGAGGGGVSITAMGRADIDGRIESLGGDTGFTLAPLTGAAGSFPGGGGTGGSGFNPTTSAGTGGRGGNGGIGGAGGNGGAGKTGGGGGGGAGGTVFLIASRVAGNGSINLAGGVGASESGANGRVLFADSVLGSTGSSLALTVAPALTSRADSLSPRADNPYFGGLAPNFAASSAGASGLLGGPAPYGLLPTPLTDSLLLSAVTSAPPRAMLAIVRHTTAPAPVSLFYTLTAPSGPTDYDAYTFVNLRSTALAPLKVNGVNISAFPFQRRGDFGGAGTRVDLANLPPNAAWIVHGPDALTQTVTVQVNSLVRTFDVLDEQALANVRYVIEPCGLADLAGQGGDPVPDGLLDNNDFAQFVTLFFALDTRADLGSQGGVAGADGLYDNNDFAAFIAIFFAGCLP